MPIKSYKFYIRANSVKSFWVLNTPKNHNEHRLFKNGHRKFILWMTLILNESNGKY